MSREKNFVFFIFYFHNDENIVESFLQKMHSFISDYFENFEIVCVDDGSDDNTVDNVKGIKGIPVTLVEMGTYQGIELAMNAGIDYSIGDFVFEFDALPLSYDLYEIVKAFEKCIRGADIVMVVPHTNRNWKSNVFYHFYNKLSGTNYELQTDLFHILSRRAINRVKSMSNVLPYRKAVYVNCGLSVEKYYVDSNYIFSRKDEGYRMGVAVDAFVLYTNAAYRMAWGFVALMFALMIGISLYAIAIRIRGIPVPGWTSIVIILCAGFLGLSVMQAIIIKYTELILKTVFSNNKYIIGAINRIEG